MIRNYCRGCIVTEFEEMTFKLLKDLTNICNKQQDQITSLNQIVSEQEQIMEITSKGLIALQDQVILIASELSQQDMERVIK